MAVAQISSHNLLESKNNWYVTENGMLEWVFLRRHRLWVVQQGPGFLWEPCQGQDNLAGWNPCQMNLVSKVFLAFSWKKCYMYIYVFVIWCNSKILVMWTSLSFLSYWRNNTKSCNSSVFSLFYSCSNFSVIPSPPISSTCWAAKRPGHKTLGNSLFNHFAAAMVPRLCFTLQGLLWVSSPQPFLELSL